MNCMTMSTCEWEMDVIAYNKKVYFLFPRQSYIFSFYLSPNVCPLRSFASVRAPAFFAFFTRRKGYALAAISYIICHVFATAHV